MTNGTVQASARTPCVISAQPAGQLDNLEFQREAGRMKDAGSRPRYMRLAANAGSRRVGGLCAERLAQAKRFRRHARPFVVRARDCEEERVMESYGASCVCSRRWGEEWAPRPADRGLKDFERSMARCMAERGF